MSDIILGLRRQNVQEELPHSWSLQPSKHLYAIRCINPIERILVR